MSLSVADIVIIAIGYISLASWLFLYVKGRKNATMFEAISEKEYPLKEIYFVGYELMQIIGYKYKSKADRKLRQEVDILYGKKYADYYIRVSYAQRVTISLTLFVAAFIVFGLTNESAALIIVLIFSALAFYYYGTTMRKKILSRSDEMLRDFSEVVSKLALLTNAGMILKDAWEDTAYAGDSALYKEMQKTIVDIRNGKSEIDAYNDFGVRCVIPEIKKFTSTIVQSFTKGNRELSNALQIQSKEVWSSKKQQARQQGEKAASKLLIPICIMFVGILIMILVPIFTNIGV